MTEKKVPQRMCIVCKQMFDKKEVVRVVKDGENLSVDSTGKKNGRGAYVCTNNCVDKIKKTHALERAFKITVSSQQYDDIVEEIKKIAR